MTLEATQYGRACQHFLRTSQRLSAGWSALQYNEHGNDCKSPADIMLSLSAVKFIADHRSTEQFNSHVIAETLETDASLDGCGITDDAAMVQPSSTTGRAGQAAAFKYFIHYSGSYCVPVLTFRAYWCADSKPLTLQEVWRAFIPLCGSCANSPAVADAGAGISMWQFVTEKEHPILRVPVFEFHPCRVELLMNHVKQNIDERTYIAAWLSIVGRFVGIDVDHKFFIPQSK